MEVTNLLDIHSREELYAWYLENHDNFVVEQWVIDALKADPAVWRNFNSGPGAYQRIKVDRIQQYNSTKRPEYAMLMLRTLIDDSRKGRMQPGWDDGGKLLGY